MSVEQKHTPEPWRAIKWSCHAVTSIVADTDPAEPLTVGGQTVAQYGLTEIADCQGSRREGGDEANAARIVACVNACAGMDDPAAVIAALRDALETYVSKFGNCGSAYAEAKAALAMIKEA